MLICGHINIFPNTFWGDGIWYFEYQILFASVTLILLSWQNTIYELLLPITLFFICHFFVSKLQVKCALSVYHIT